MSLLNGSGMPNKANSPAAKPLQRMRMEKLSVGATIIARNIDITGKLSLLSMPTGEACKGPKMMGQIAWRRR